MSDIREKFVEIISELSRIQKLPQPYRDEDDDFPLPRQLGAGNGLFINISKKLDQFIADIARAMRNSSSLKSQLTADEYREIVRRAFGPALAKIELDADLSHNAQSVLTDVEATVSKNIDWVLNNGGQEYAFGCTLFTYEDVAPFEIGPVRFEPRLIWLDRKASDGCWARVASNGRIERFDHQIADGPISKITKRRIMRTWQGNKLRDRQSSVDSHNEHDILKAIGDCPYVCSVKIEGFGGKAGQDKALLALRLALATISLFWARPSNALDGLNLYFDREMRNRYLLSFTRDGLISSGGMISNMPHAPWIDRKVLEANFKEYAPIFAIAGEAINWLLNPTVNHTRSELQNILVQAMLWFHDGCRETVDLKAIVCFASCMDILASGGGQDSIRKLISARLGIEESTKIHRDGLTVKEVIKQIYDDGRNRFSHGPMKSGKNVWGDKLGHDWSETRDLAEWLARQCLVRCMEWMATHPSCDNPGQLLKA